MNDEVTRSGLMDIVFGLQFVCDIILIIKQQDNETIHHKLNNKEMNSEAVISYEKPRMKTKSECELRIIQNGLHSMKPYLHHILQKKE